MEFTQVSKVKWILVPLFTLLGFGLLASSAQAEDAAVSDQSGNNSSASAQDAGVASGDAVASSQSTGTSGGTSVENTNIATGDNTAVSGDVNANVEATVNVGPSATADNGGVAIARQRGNNTATVNQNTTVKSGDAVAGSQITGVVSGGGGGTTVENTNIATGDNTAVSGDVNANVDATVNIGPSADADGGVALANQRGNNTARVNQTTTVASGDAVSASQVTGVVGGGRVLVDNVNLALGDSTAVSGDVVADVTATVNIGPAAQANGGIATARQRGNNRATVNQNTLVGSGDAVAASQITGIVGGRSLVDSVNLALGDPVAASGDVVATVTSRVNIGPSAGPDGVTIATQTGSNTARVNQRSVLRSGDAVTGSQVTGIVGWWRSWLRL